MSAKSLPIEDWTIRCFQIECNRMQLAFCTGCHYRVSKWWVGLLFFKVHVSSRSGFKKPLGEGRFSPMGWCVLMTQASSIWAFKPCLQGLPFLKGNDCNPPSLLKEGLGVLLTPLGEGTVHVGPGNVVHMRTWIHQTSQASSIFKHFSYFHLCIRIQQNLNWQMFIQPLRDEYWWSH